LASRLLLLPLIIHEQNAIPGMTNKLLSKIATRVLQAFPNTFSESSKTHHTGNPIRQSILDLEAPEIRFNDRDEELRILIVGGSLGAQALNETVPQALAISGTQNKLNIWHQAGKNKLEETIQAYDSANVKAMVVEFIDDMDEAYAWADLIICRAGAMTIAELCAVGLAAILIPYPYAVDDHQTANAKYLVEANAAILIQQNELSAHKLANELHKIIHAGRELLLKMATRAFALARPDATSSVMQHCLEVAK
jgi:UDP-N-acetylglucosamine--N-acetylmuramyl-(pentapeptide) pyrophosphoryl-undecaprenol N-acetylglucosamine transferase